MAAYIPYTYAANLQLELSVSKDFGQGGQLEGSAEHAIRCLTRIRCSCYSFVAKEMASRLGLEEAEAIVRRGIRDFGRYLGGKMRLAAEARGLPLDVQNLSGWWYPSARAAARYSGTSAPSASMPHYSAHTYAPCPNMDAYGPLCPQKLAVAICEEIHLAIAKGFNPDIDVWHPALLPRGQNHCGFVFEMPFEAAQRAMDAALQQREILKAEGKPLAQDLHEPQPEGDPSDPAYAYVRYAPRHCHQYHFIANELARSLGTEETMRLLRAAARDWGTWRGEEMRREHLRRGWPLNVETFIRYYDDPAAGDAWVAENVELNEREHHRTVTKSAFATLFAEVGTGQYALPLYEDAIPAQATAYHPAVRVEILHLMERGDSVSEFHIWME